MEKRKRSKRNNSIFRVAIIFAILILINVISVRIFGRIDLTASKIYTLSDASRDLVRKVDDKITLKAYFTEDLPAPYNNNKRILLDLFNDYKAYAGGNIQYEFINPTGESGEKETQANGIPPVEVQVVHEDKVEVKRAFMGLVILYEDKKEVIPVLQDLDGLEYEISSAFKRLTHKDKKVVAFATGHGEFTMDDLKVASAQLGEQYELLPLDLSKTLEVPDNISALLIIDPKNEFSDSAKFAIDQYIMRGGKLALLNGTVKIDPTLQNPNGTLANIGLDSMLESWGIKVNPDLVRDAQCATIIVSRQQGQYQIQSQVQFPYLIRVTNFNRNNIITRDLNNLILQFASSIDTAYAKKAGINAQVIAYSSEATARQKDAILADPFYQYTEKDFPDALVPLAAVYSGSFKSFFEGKQPQPGITRSKDTKILVVGTGLFMEDNVIQSSRDNYAFFANLVDYLTDDAGLITIRTKNVSLPPLEKTSDSTRKLLKYGNMLLPPLLVIAFGLFRWRRRIAKKKFMESQI